jgi:uncharacterized protein YwqG
MKDQRLIDDLELTLINEGAFRNWFKPYENNLEKKIIKGNFDNAKAINFTSVKIREFIKLCDNMNFCRSIGFIPSCKGYKPTVEERKEVALGLLTYIFLDHPNTPFK